MSLGIACALGLIPLTDPGETAEKGAVLLEAKFDPNVLRTRLRAQTNRFSGILEKFADEIIAQTKNPSVRYGMIRWKTNALPRLQEAMFRPDPRFAFVDTWAFVMQIDAAIDRPDTRAILGEYVKLSRDAVRQLERAIEDIFVDTFVGSDIAAIRSVIQQWAAAHPLLVDGMLSRESTEPLFASIVGRKNKGAFAAIDTFPETLSDLFSRLDVYTTFLPKQVRWQSELMMGETLRQLPQTLTVAERGFQALEQIPDLVSAERQLVLAEVQATIDRERTRLLADIDKEGHGLIDHLFRRALQLVLLGAGALLCVALIVARYLRRRQA